MNDLPAADGPSPAGIRDQAERRQGKSARPAERPVFIADPLFSVLTLIYRAG
jgi:hypothetical protein